MEIEVKKDEKLQVIKLTEEQADKINEDFGNINKCTFCGSEIWDDKNNIPEWGIIAQVLTIRTNGYSIEMACLCKNCAEIIVKAIEKCKDKS